MTYTDDTHPILSGIVGSTAYGLATPESDVYRLGIHAITTNRLFTIASQPPETITTSKPDSASHEIHKACRLMLSGNPTVLEVLWLSDYEVITPIGEQLIDIRSDFLCATRVRNAYEGYSRQQYHRLVERGRFGGSLDTRREKHARHILRLLEQGLHLYRTGQVKLKVDYPDWIHETAKDIAETGDKGTELVEGILADYEHWFNETSTPLPDAPRYDRIENLIQTTRKTYWND